jgi:tetratricopeptide (TPR) repeat protein
MRKAGTNASTGGRNAYPFFIATGNGRGDAPGSPRPPANALPMKALYPVHSPLRARLPAQLAAAGRASLAALVPTLLLLLSLGVCQAAGPASPDPQLPSAPYRAPYVPTRDDDVLEQVPPTTDPAVRSMAALRAQQVADPRNRKLSETLARAYIDFGRRVGDARYAGYAEAVIAPWMATPAPSADALVLQATILQFRHQFADARRLLTLALKREPRNAQAWLTLATLDNVQGEYAAAAKDCVQAGQYGGLIINLACNGSLRSRLGQARQSLALLGQLDGDIPGATPEFKAWVQGLLAESDERLGDWPGAEAHYRKALTYTPDDNFLLVAYADFLLDRGRPGEVPALLAVRVQSDTAFLRLALAAAATNSPDAARYTWLMAARFAALKQRGDDYFGREETRFALHLQHDPQTALELARKNWQVQREPWDARVFLEAAQAANQPRAAMPVVDFVQQSGLEDPLVRLLAQDLAKRLNVETAAR